MKKWTIGDRKYFPAPVDTPEIREWLEKLPDIPVHELINKLYFEAVSFGWTQVTEDRLLDWRRARVVEEIERRIGSH